MVYRRQLPRHKFQYFLFIFEIVSAGKFAFRVDVNHSGAVATQYYRRLEFPMGVLVCFFLATVCRQTHAKGFIRPVLA